MNPAAPPVFEARNLQVVKGGSLILDVPSLAVSEGEILVLIGPNGAGKSTLLQTLYALQAPYRGQILFRGQQIGTDIPVLQYRRRLAMILQEPLLFDTTVHHNVASGLKLRGMKRDETDAIVANTLNRFGIAHLKNRSARTLSGGEARRTSIARAFATSPEILLLDEPFSSLDSMIRETLIEDLENVLRETRITTIFVTHDRMEALRLATRLGVMNAGKILQIGSTSEVFNRPADEFVASLVGFDSIFAGKVIRRHNDTFVASVSGLELQAIGEAVVGEKVSLCVRPENVAISTTASATPSNGINTFEGIIEKITPMGPYRKVQLNCGLPLNAYVTTHSIEERSLSKGIKVVASLRLADIHVVRQVERRSPSCARL